jgi:hypothetical protein
MAGDILASSVDNHAFAIIKNRISLNDQIKCRIYRHRNTGGT